MTNRDTAIGVALQRRGITLAQAQPGDIVVAHSKGIIGWLIRFGTRSKWNHVAVIVDVGPTEQSTFVVQAEARGVELAPLSMVAPGGEIAILACPASRTTVVAAARAMIRRKYAFLTIASIALKIIARVLHLPWRLDVRDSSTLICSAVGAIALLAGGWLPALAFGDLYQVTPAELAVALAHAG